jgi:hypothetical protein
VPTEDQQKLLLGDRELYEAFCQEAFVGGVSARFQIRAYNLPLYNQNLFGNDATPPWAESGSPGTLNIGPLLSGAHPTVPKGGRVAGSHRGIGAGSE